MPDPNLRDALTDALILGILWLVYFSVHSLLASLAAKRWCSTASPAWMPGYRLTYNFLAIILILPPVWLLHNGNAVILWDFSGYMTWVANTLTIMAIIGFLYSLRFYDGQEFMGIKQLKEQITTVEDQENFQLSPLHHYVRHPWYSFALVIIWTRDMNSLMLVSAGLMTAYFMFGSRLEERKLIHYYGDVYRQYRAKVPGLIPLPWKFLSDAEANILINDYQATQSR
jgi:protein-S-isoprenylcysteine O-methyltransferase Ste14